MRYLIALVLGILIGAATFVLAMYFNPFTGQSTLSPFAVSKATQLEVTFSAVPGETTLYTDSGESVVKPFPERVSKLWEPAIADTYIAVSRLNDSRGATAGFGIKFFSPSEETQLIKSELLANSAWHVYLDGRGTLLVDQVENRWPYMRDVVVPARFNSADNWTGSFHRIMTTGPGALGTGRVTWGSGDFAGVAGEVVETLSAREYSAKKGPLQMTGALTISQPSILQAEE